MIKNLIKQLRDEEGIVPYAYSDHLGFLTIGCGRLIDKRKGGGLSQDEIDYLLTNDIKKVNGGLDDNIAWWRSLSEPRQAVLQGMAFQMGVAGLLGFKNTLAMVKAGDYDGAAKGMLQSKWATQTPSRAKRMSDQMRTGQWQWK